IPHLMTALVEEAVTVGDLGRLFHLKGGRVGLVEVTVPAGAANVGRPLFELHLPGDAVIVAILREGHVVMPQPETVLAVGDEVMALASTVAEPSLRAAVVGDGTTGGDSPAADGGTGTT
ncbi:MAG: TrkA C-terminal domain-containing protein, partial [Acidimicrobiia bacterium]